MDQEKPKIEVMEDPEYSDLLIDNIMFHGNNIRNPKEWYPELLYNSKLEQGNKTHRLPVGFVLNTALSRYASTE